MIGAVIYVTSDDVNDAQELLETAIQYARDELHATIPNDTEAKCVRKLREGEPALHIPISEDGARAWICLNHPCVRDNRSKTGGEYAIEQITDDDAKHLILPNVAPVNPGAINAAVENRCKVHCVDENLTIKPDANGLQGRAIDAVESMTGSDTAELDLLNKSWSGGRPPIGCEVEENRLVKADNYDTVRETLQAVRDDETTKTAAAERIDVTRKTITNAADRTSLYQLD